jgi:hypothetical protein
MLEGYRNVIIHDPELQGATVERIRCMHQEFAKEHNIRDVARYAYCLIMDRESVMSILASPHPPDTRGWE